MQRPANVHSLVDFLHEGHRCERDEIDRHRRDPGAKVEGTHRTPARHGTGDNQDEEGVVLRVARGPQDEPRRAPDDSLQQGQPGIRPGTHSDVAGGMVGLPQEISVVEIAGNGHDRHDKRPGDKSRRRNPLCVRQRDEHGRKRQDKNVCPGRVSRQRELLVDKEQLGGRSRPQRRQDVADEVPHRFRRPVE